MRSRTKTRAELTHCRDPSPPHYCGHRIPPVMLISALPVKIATHSGGIVATHSGMIVAIHSGASLPRFNRSVATLAFMT